MKIKKDKNYLLNIQSHKTNQETTKLNVKSMKTTISRKEKDSE